MSEGEKSETTQPRDVDALLRKQDWGRIRVQLLLFARPEELWKALEDMAAKDDAERIKAMSDAELDDELREGGLDPAKVRAEGAAFVEMLFARRERETKAATVPELEAMLEEIEELVDARADGGEKPN